MEGVGVSGSKDDGYLSFDRRHDLRPDSVGEEVKPAHAPLVPSILPTAGKGAWPGGLQKVRTVAGDKTQHLGVDPRQALGVCQQLLGRDDLGSQIVNKLCS